MYVNTLTKIQHTVNSLISIFWFFDLPLKTPEIYSFTVALNFTNKLAEFSDSQGKTRPLKAFSIVRITRQCSLNKSANDSKALWEK